MIEKQYFRKTLWLMMMMQYHIKFDYKQLNNSDDIMWINIQWSLEPSLWPWPWTQQSNLFTRHSIIGGSCHKYLFCRNKSFVMTSFVATKVCLLWQNVCHDKIRFVATKYFFATKVFVTTNICHEQTKVLLRQTYFCRDKRYVLSWQTHICHDKSKLHKIMFVMTNICRVKHVFVMTKVLSRQAYLWQLSPMLIFWLMMIDAP